MKTQVAAALAALVAAAAIPTPALSQSQESANAQKYGVAVVDINYIFKNHTKFRESMDAMKEDFKTVDGQLKASQQKIVAAQEQKKNFNPGSEEFKQLDEQIVRMNATLQVEVTQKRKELVEREAEIYYNTYVQVDQAITYYAQRQGLGLVLRFNGEPADKNNRESILRSINKTVHFQNQVDITPDVLMLLNRSQQAARPQAGAQR